MPHGGTAPAFLRHLCERALETRYPIAPPRALLEKELGVIHHLGLDDYFLIVWDLVRFARSAGIRCQGRGSAANSLVAYLLGISPLDPVAGDLVFERFLAPERAAPPDIDLDLAADRREEVIQYVYRRYGAEHAAMASTHVTFRTRSALRDLARVLGLPPEAVTALLAAGEVGTQPALPDGAAAPPALLHQLLRLLPRMEGLPRHLGIHNGGLVLSGPPLERCVPLEPATMEGRMVTQWDKAGLEAAGFIKFDLLGLRMLSALEDAVCIVEATTGRRPDLEALAPDDPAVYAMLCRGETLGVFQVESRAQAQLLPRFQPRTFADLVLQLSLVRPGPLQADMVHPYLRRREGREAVTYLHPCLRPALEETLGVLIFQEQVLKVARDAAGFTPGEAEQLRRALGHKEAAAEVARFRARFLAGATERGLTPATAEQIFAQLEGFAGYSFPKAHAAAFALLTYQAAWLRHYHPVAFFAGLLRHQPMGFYPSHTVIAEARRCGVQILTVDVGHSAVQAAVEADAIRLGLEVVHGVGAEVGAQIVAARQAGPFRSLVDFCRRTGLGRRAVESLIFAGAFDPWGVPRRRLAWELAEALEEAHRPAPLLLGDAAEAPDLPALTAAERLQAEVALTGVHAGGSITALVAQQFRALGVTSSDALPGLRPGAKVRVGGAIVARQQPPTAGGVCFLALEDAAGVLNVVVRPEVQAAYREALLAPFVVLEGVVQERHGALSVLASRVLPVTVV